MRDAVDWSGVHLWWGDERFLPDGDPDRNETQARNALIDALGDALPAENVHPMPAPSDDVPTPEASADAYGQSFAAAGSPAFDVLLLGMGPDGHVASLFPGHEALAVSGRPTVAVHGSPKPPPDRVTLTLHKLNASHRILLVVSGAAKAPMLARVIAGPDPEVPASLLDRARLEIIADAAALDG